MSQDPLSTLEDIENSGPEIPQMPKMSPEQELAIVKAPMYQSQKQTDLLIETTINALYKQLMEKTAVIMALQAENAELRKKGEKPTENPPN